MPTHRVSKKSVHDSPRSPKKFGECSVCGRTEVVWNGLSWRCVRAEKAKAAQKRTTDRKRAVRARKRQKKQDSEALAYLWRQIIFERAGRKCEICGQGPFEKGDFRLQAHHLVKRSQSRRLQLDPSNGAALCPGCHLSADRDPIRCMAIVLKDDPGTVEYLLEERRNTAHPDPEFVKERLIASAKLLGIEVSDSVK